MGKRRQTSGGARAEDVSEGCVLTARRGEDETPEQEALNEVWAQAEAASRQLTSAAAALPPAAALPSAVATLSPASAALPPAAAAASVPVFASPVRRLGRSPRRVARPARPALPVAPPTLPVAPPTAPPTHVAFPPTSVVASAVPVSVPSSTSQPLLELPQLPRGMTPEEEVEEMARLLIDVAKKETATWNHLVGWFLQSQTTEREFTLSGIAWERDLIKEDFLARNPGGLEMWAEPVHGTPVHQLMCLVGHTEQRVRAFRQLVAWWCQEYGPDVMPVLLKAGFTYQYTPHDIHGYKIMDDIKGMEEGPEKARLLAKAAAEAPRYYKRCMEDGNCGLRSARKREREAEEAEDYEYKRRRGMAYPDLRPTQVHAVPEEERATDSQGRKLPWALEWPDDHYLARHKRQPQEKGPFGKRPRRRSGSSREKRTATPAKKENPTLDSFERALKFDIQRLKEEAKQGSSDSLRAPKDAAAASHHGSSMIKEPTQVVLYGFSPSSQWAAIDFYEKASRGKICEDYERDPPVELRKFPTPFSAAANVRSGPLTKAESTLVRQYRGGNCWIKVTFDSAEAADRAIYNSPHSIQGHWVYARAFNGVGPEVDEPIPVQVEEKEQGMLGASKPTRRVSQTLGASFAHANRDHSKVAPATLPRSFTTTVTTQADRQEPVETPSLSSVTASSATATAPETPSLRNRTAFRTQPHDQDSNDQAPPKAPSNPYYFTHFPDVPRTVLLPAHEALLRNPSWLERQIARLREKGWLPGDMVGDGVPRLANGDLDWANASLYWRVLHWIDCKLGTDICGMKETADDEEL